MLDRIEIDRLPIFGGDLAGTDLESCLRELGAQNIHLNKMNLSVRTNFCLHKLQIETLAEVVRVRPDSFLRVKNFGRISLMDLQESVRQYLTALDRGETSSSFGFLSPSESKKLKRALEIKRLYEELGTYDTVGRQLGVSRQRVAQIIKNLETRWGIFVAPPRRRRREALQERFPKELLTRMVYQCGTFKKFREKFRLSPGEVDYLLVNYNIGRSELEQDLALKRILTEYEGMVQELGFHPSTTLMQRERKWRALYARIEHRWGIINRFRRYYGFPIPKPGNPFFREDMERGLRYRRSRLAAERSAKREAIVALIRSRGGAWSRLIQQELRIKPSWVWRLLKELVDEGRIKRKGSGSQVIYIAVDRMTEVSVE